MDQRRNARDGRSTRQPRFAAIAALVVLYFAMPVESDRALHGVPFAPPATATVAIVVFLAVCFWRSPFAQRQFRWTAAIMVLLFAASVVVARSSPASGWTASYYANDQWSGAPQWSSDFRLPSATRIDRRIWFEADSFPAYYLNDASFDRGDRREVTEPMSIEWRGFTRVNRPTTERLSLTARGRAIATLDGQPLLNIASTQNPASAERIVGLDPGAHALSVRYAKPADVDGLVDFKAVDAVDPAGGPLRVAPERIGGAPGWPLVVAPVLDAAMLITFVAATIGVVRSARRDDLAQRSIAAGLFAGFGLQGWFAATRFANRVVSLTSGDDWFGFESRARDILHNGPLMTLGKPLGQGAAYFYHPFYSYFLAVVHLVTGESLFGPIFVQFLILAAVATILYWFAADLFGRPAAAAGIAALIVIFELDFVRYYTVTLLSENLYILTVTLTLVPFARWVRSGSAGDLCQAAFWGGVSSITRPAMMMFFVPAGALVAFVARDRVRRAVTAVATTATFVGVWAAVIAPITLRNWIVAHRAVLISEGLGAGFIKYNVPPNVDPALYGQSSGGDVLSGLRVLARIAWQHPAAMLVTQARKAGFSLGMVHWFGGYRPHPELIGVTLLYAAACIASARMRARDMWPIHLFVLSHVASMGLTSPWNYGYRLIIPPFIYMSTLAAAATTTVLLSLTAARRPHVHAWRV